MKIKLQVTLFFVAILLFSCKEESNKLELFPLKEGASYGYFDASGKEIITAKFAYAAVFRDGLAIVKLQGNTPKYTFIDKKGKVVFNKTFGSVSVFSEGLAWVAPNNADLTAIDKNGQEKFSIKGAEHVSIFKEHLAAYSVKDSVGEKWGFVNASGETVIKPQFFATGNFSHGLCAVKDEDGNWGFIDKKGTYKIESKFKSAGDFENGKVIVQDQFEAKFGVIEEKANFIIKPKFQAMKADKDIFLVQLNDKWGWCDAEGKMIIDCKFEEAFKFGENDLAPVKLNGYFGFIDRKGVAKINFQFAKAYPFNGEIAYAEKKKNSDNVYSYAGFIDKKGNFAVKPKFIGIASDLVNYFNNDNAEFETIQTDYFDIAGILKEINVNNPANFSFNQDVSEIVPKLFHKKLPVNKALDLTVFFLRKITDEAYLSLYVIRNNENKIAGFWYKVELDGKSFYKPNELEKAFIKNLKGYTKIEAPDEFINQGVIKAYKNNKHILLITGSNLGNEFIVEILNPEVNLDGYDSRYYGNHQNTDTDDLASMKAIELFRHEE